MEKDETRKSLVTRHTSQVTRHTSHVTRHTLCSSYLSKALATSSARFSMLSGYALALSNSDRSLELMERTACVTPVAELPPGKKEDDGG
jgi:hypothetical protein